MRYSKDTEGERAPQLPTTMITTVTIERLCLQEESSWPDAVWKRERLDWIHQEMDEGRYGNLDKAFSHIGADPVHPADRPQLWCEAAKFLQLRLAGFELQDALDRMVGIAHA